MPRRKSSSRRRTRTARPSPQAPARKAVLLRLPPDLHSALKRWSDAERRSLNAHVTYLLSRAVARRKDARRG